ncbi:MAG: substrate-binding domain-containing protein [Bacteroidota bacterium]
MKKIKLFSVVAVIMMTAIFSGCGSSGKIDETPTRGNIKISVDESYTLALDAQISTFEAIYTYAVIRASYKNEVDCFADLLKDSVRLIIANRNLTPAEDQNLRSQQIYPKVTKIAYDALCFIVNKENSDSVFQFEQIAAIFSGKIKTWADINKNSKLGDLSVVFDNNKSGNPRYIKEKFKLNRDFPSYCYAVNSNKEVINYVEKNKNAIGIISVNWISDAADTVSHDFLNRITVAGVSQQDFTEGPYLKPYQGYIADGSYPFIREVFVINREYFSGLGTGFASFIAGEKGQRIFLKSGLVPATMPIRLIEIKK